jgi:hypothetical protein
VHNETIVGRGPALGNLEERGELRDDSTNEPANNAINQAIREGRRDHVEEESRSEGRSSLARKSEHFVYFFKKKKSSVFGLSHESIEVYFQLSYVP